MGMSIDDLQRSEAFGGTRGRRGGVTFLPEPEPAEQWATIVSVDDHVVEPPDTFEGRFPARFADQAPRLVDTEDGGQAWRWLDDVIVGGDHRVLAVGARRIRQERDGALVAGPRRGELEIVL